MRRLIPLMAGVLLAGCATYNALAPQERATVERELARSGEDRFLRVSFYVTPFFGDATKKLLTAVPPEEVRLLDHPDGKPVNPGAVEKILPAGTKARILKVEFPTAWSMTERLAYTPRHLPWIYISLAGEQTELPYILALRPDLDTPDRFYNDLERYLSAADPSRLMSQWSEQIRASIAKKEAVTDMPAEAVEMALGYPELKIINFEGAVKREEWFYAGKQRVAIIADGRLLRVENRAVQGVP